MYRPTKRKFVRRVSAASVVAVAAAVGVGFTILSQSGASNSAIVKPGEVTATTGAASSTSSTSSAGTTPLYHIVGLKSHHDDGGTGGDN